MRVGVGGRCGCGCRVCVCVGRERRGVAMPAGLGGVDEMGGTRLGGGRCVAALEGGVVGGLLASRLLGGVGEGGFVLRARLRGGEMENEMMDGWIDGLMEGRTSYMCPLPEPT